MDRNLDSKIVRIQKIMGIPNLIMEASKKNVLVNKLGLKEEIADYLDRTCGGLSVIMLKKLIDLLKGGYVDGSNVSDKDVIRDINSNNGFSSLFRQGLTSIMDWVRVGLNGNLGTYKDDAFVTLLALSKNWHNSLDIGDGDINYVEKNSVILDFRDKDGYGFYWVDLNTNDSPEECDRMGHCGRTDRNNTLYSLRETRLLPGGKFTLNKSHLTASINDDDGTLYQLKGPKNSKPKEEYHKYILPLFYNISGGREQPDFLIRGFGSEYASNLDFKITDLPNETIKELYQNRPELFDSYSLRKKLSELGLIEMKKFGEFILEIDVDDIGDYVNGDFVYSTRRWKDAQGFNIEKRIYFFEALLTEPWDLWDNYGQGDLDSIIDYHTNNENESKIKEYLLSLSDNPSKYEDHELVELIKELDEDGEVRSALYSALNDAESEDYVNKLQDHLKDKLETYGTVLSLNDAGVKIKVDVQPFIDDYLNDDGLEEIIEDCGGEEDLDCIFNEIVRGYYGFDKPKWNFDDRYYPHVDNSYFNDVLSDRLSEFM